ncbi:hypothetical protein MFRU_023g00340 [Monilinia fructicola]|nr:hypothetical protein MFRU_023g00340 [Monilinia fructicola]
MATKEALSSHFTVDRLADLNEMIRNVVATKPDNNTAMVLNRDMADVLLYKDLLIKEANKHLSKVEEDYQVTLDQLFFSNDAKSDLIDKARAETDRVRAELAVHTELEEKKLRYHNLWSPQDASWSQRKQCQEQISELEGELTEARDRIQAWKGVFRDNSQTIGELRLREKELLKGPSASMVEGDKTQKQLDASRGEIKRLMELQAANKAEYRSLVEKLKAQNEVTKRQLDASLERAGGYHDLQSANNSQKQELASLKEENRRMKLSLQLHADAQKVNVTRFASLKEMLKVKGDEYDALQVDFDRLKDEHGRCGDTHQRLQTQLDQGRQWANSVVNNCPFDLDRVVAAESARDLANSLRVIAELEFQVLQQDNTYRQPRSMVPNPADDVLPSVESHPVQVESQARVLSSPSQGPTRSVSPHAQAYQEYQSNVERKQVLNAAAAKESFDANQAFSETSSDYQMDNDYFEDDLRRKAVIPVLITRNTTVPFPPFDNDLSTRLLADINQQDQAEEPEDDDSNLDEPHPVSIKVEYQEDTDELPDYEDYQPIDNAGVRPASPRIKSEELSANIAAESYLNNLHGYNPNAFGGRYAPAQTDGYLDPNPDVLSDDDDDDEPLLPGGGCSHRRVFADGTCASCGNKLPRHREDTPPEAPRPVQTGFRQARQAHQARQALQALQALQAPPTVAVPVQTGFRQVRQALQALQARQARQASPTVAVPGQTGFRQVRQALQARQARQASPAVAVPVINNKQSARLEKECYSSMFGGKCGGIGCTCNLTRNPLPEVSSTGPPAGDTTEAACPHNIQFMGICSICGKDVSAVAPRAIPRAVPRAVPRTLSPSPPPASSRSPPSKKRGRFVDDSDSDSDSFDGGFRPTKKAKTVATPPERSQSPGVAPFEHDPTDFAPPSEHDNSGSDAPGPSDGDAAN